MSDLSYPNDPAPRRPSVVPVLDSAGAGADLFLAARDGTAEGRSRLASAAATDAALSSALAVAEAALWATAQQVAAVWGGPLGVTAVDVVHAIRDRAAARGA